MQAIKVSAALADSMHRPGRGIVILIYHRVGARTKCEVDLPAELFDRQMAELAESGRAMSLGAALEVAGCPTPPERDPVVVTFDDGTADFADEVVPVIERHHLPVTLYVATDFVERGRAFPNDGVPASWGALRDALSTGLVSIGSHTHTHALLDRLRVAEADQELTTSRSLIEDRLGVRALDFAYPKAVLASPDVEELVRTGFRSAALSGAHANPYGHTDPYRLTRTPIQVSDGMRWYRNKVNGGMGLEDSLRRRRNRRRYADTTT